MVRRGETPGELLRLPVIYVASAGTGKTHQLIEDFYVALVECNFDPTRLLALTFTENAAEEMRERIRRKLLAQRGLAALPLAQELPIGTVHSFCRSELSRYALLAGISPQFVVMDEAEAAALARRVLLAIFTERFDSEPKRAQSTLVREARFNSYFHSSEFGISLESEMLRLYHQLRVLGVLDFARLQLAVADCEWNEARVRLVRAMDTVLATSPEKMGGKSVRKLAELQVLLRQRLPKPEALEANRENFHLLGEIAESINLQGSKSYRELLGPFREEVLPLCQREMIQERLPAVRDELVDVLAELDRRLAIGKGSRNVLDFEDLQLKFLQLLQQHPEVARGYRRRLGKVFVDEFQDTNPLQVALIDAIVGTEAQYLVGDPKQAIYAFRYADPQGIVRKREAFAEKGLVKELQANYRSRPEILRFVNEFFHRLEAEEGGSPLGFAYEEVHPACAFAEKAAPSVEFFCLPAGRSSELNSEERQYQEARWVAAYLHQVVENRLIQHTQRGKNGSLRYGDFAILVRRNRSIPVFEEALALAGVPFVSETSSGFLETPEIAALTDGLQLLLTPDVDMLAARVLRSDLVGVSSQGLFELVTACTSDGEMRQPIFTVLERSHSVLTQDADRAAVKEFSAWFSQLRARLPLMTAAEVAQEAILASRLREKLVAHGSSQRALLNLMKFTDLALKMRGQGTGALFALTSQIRELKYLSAPLGEMWVEAGDFVGIRSVHKAKGLTIGGVILAGVNFSSPKSRPTFIVEPSPDGDGFRLGVRHRLARASGVDEPFYAEGVARVESSADAEELRLLYVALTRAVEHLVVSGVPTPESGKLTANPWGKRLGSLLQRRDDGKLGLTPPFAELVQLKEFEPEEMEEEGAQLSAYPSLSELARGQESKVSPADRSLAQELIAEAGHPPDLSTFNRYIFSVSQFLAWASNPEDFATALRPVAGAEELDLSEREAEYVPSDDTGEAARQLGVLVHELLAVVCAHLRDVSPQELVPAALASDFLAKWLPERVDAIVSERKRLEAMLAGFAGSELFSRLKQARAVYPEFGFLLRRERTLFRGRIDLLLIRDAEVWLVDFKSDRLSSESAAQEVASRYRDQLLFYTRAARALYALLRVQPSLFFLDGGVSWPFGFADDDFAALDDRLDKFIKFNAEFLQEDFLASRR